MKYFLRISKNGCYGYVSSFLDPYDPNEALNTIQNLVGYPQIGPQATTFIK